MIGLVLRLLRLDYAPLWFDEAFTATWLNLPWGEMLGAVVGDNHPPLYFLVLKSWGEVAGHSPWALRLPSMLASWLAVPLTAAVADAISGRRAGRWAAWLTAGAPFLLHHGQEARMYGLVTALAAAHLLVLARFLVGTSSRLGWGFVVTAAALLASHYYTIFFLGGGLLTLCVLHPRPVRDWLPAAVATCCTMAAALGAAVLLARHGAGGEYDLGWLALPGAVWSILSGYALLPSSAALHASGWRAVLPYVPVAAVAAIAFAVIAIQGLRALSPSARVLVLAMLATAIVGPFAVRAVLSVGLNPRYFAAALPVLIVLLAAGAPPSLGANARSVAMLTLVAVLALGCALHLSDPAHGREDIRAAGQWLDAHVPMDEEILVTSREMEYLARFHWPARRFHLYPAAGVLVASDNASSIAAELPFSGHDRAIYVVGREWLTDPDGALQRAVAGRYAPCEGIELRGIRILCLLRPHRDTNA